MVQNLESQEDFNIRIRLEFEDYKRKQSAESEEGDLNYLGTFIDLKLDSYASKIDTVWSGKRLEKVDKETYTNLAIILMRQIAGLQQLMKEFKYEITSEKRKMELRSIIAQNDNIKRESMKLKTEENQTIVAGYPSSLIIKLLITMGLGLISSTTALLGISFDYAISVNPFLLLIFLVSYGFGFGFLLFGLDLQNEHDKAKFNLYKNRHQIPNSQFKR